MQLNPHSGRARRRPIEIAALLATPLLLLALHTAVVAQTRTVGVEVTFVERIEVALVSGAQSDSDGSANNAVENAAPGSGAPADTAADTTANEAFVAALSIEATPRRAVTLHVAASAAPDTTSFLCTYGRVRQAECGGSGVAAVSLAEAELTIDRGAQRAGETASDKNERTDIEVTIIYQ